MTQQAQSFWLEHLQCANHYNRWIVSQIFPYLGNEILEVGCGNGNFTELLAQTGAHLTAIDVNETYVNAAVNRLQARPNVEILVADATQIAWARSSWARLPWAQQDSSETKSSEAKSFDTIILLDVLEHIEEDVKLLHHLSHGLRSGGRLIIKVPALDWLYSPMDQAIGHYRRYTRKTLSETLRQAGCSDFSEPIVWYFNAAGIPGWWLNGRVLQHTTPPSQQIGWFDQAVPVLKAIESRLSMPIGLSLFAVAKKV